MVDIGHVVVVGFRDRGDRVMGRGFGFRFGRGHGRCGDGVGDGRVDPGFGIVGGVLDGVLEGGILGDGSEWRGCALAHDRADALQFGGDAFGRGRGWRGVRGSGGGHDLLCDGSGGLFGRLARRLARRLA